MTNRAWVAMFLLVGLVLGIGLTFAWYVATQPDNPQRLGQAVPAAAVSPMPAGQDMTEMMTAWGRSIACREAALAMVKPADATRKTWTGHRNAHRRGPHGTGEISQERMVAIWKQTLEAWEREDPAYGGARDAMVAACREG